MASAAGTRCWVTRRAVGPGVKHVVVRGRVCAPRNNAGGDRSIASGHRARVWGIVAPGRWSSARTGLDEIEREWTRVNDSERLWTRAVRRRHAAVAESFRSPWLGLGAWGRWHHYTACLDVAGLTGAIVPSQIVAVHATIGRHVIDAPRLDVGRRPPVCGWAGRRRGVRCRRGRELVASPAQAVWRLTATGGRARVTCAG